MGLEVDQSGTMDESDGRISRLARASYNEIVNITPLRDTVGGLLLFLNDHSSVSLGIKGRGADYTAVASVSDLPSRSEMDRFVSHVWGTYLQNLSHLGLSQEALSAAGPVSLDGNESVEEILDLLAAHLDRVGKPPERLLLPVRYAVALMKLGPSYWGHFYPKIREVGIQAFCTEPLFGMRVEIVYGMDAPLEVAGASVSVGSEA